MDKSIIRSAAWYRAITLIERRPLRPTTPEAELNTDLARRCVQRWRAQDPFATDSYFTQRLATDGLSEAEFYRLLGESIEAVQGRVPPPDWLTGFAQAFVPTDSSSPFPLSEKQPVRETDGFLSLIEPLIGQGRVRLHEGVQALSWMYPAVPFDGATVEALLVADLPGHLLSMVDRTLVLELNVARVQDLLTGGTPHERFGELRGAAAPRQGRFGSLRGIPRPGPPSGDRDRRLRRLRPGILATPVRRLGAHSGHL